MRTCSRASRWLDAAAGTDVGWLTDGAEVTLDAPATGQYGVRVETLPAAVIGSLRLQLSGAKAVTRTDNAAPYTLYSGGGEGLPQGAYTLQATAYPDPAGGGTALQTLSVSFTVTSNTAPDDPEPAPLTASFSDVPAVHDGSGSFGFEVAFSEDVGIGYATMRDDAFEVDEGDVTRARRVNGRHDLWEITVEPDGREAVSIALPGNRTCGTTGAVCTRGDDPKRRRRPRGEPHQRGDRRGCAGAGAADGHLHRRAVRARRGGGDFHLRADLQRGVRAELQDVARRRRIRHQGVDYTAASGTLSFQAGESSKTIEVTVLDDSHDDDGETLTLSNPSSGRLTDAEATGTIENRDPLPRALLARFGRTAAVHVVEHVEERLQAPREPGFRGRFAGRELRRGMESELALSFLSQLGGSAGANGYGVGGHDPMAGSPGAGFGGMGSLRTPGLARGGVGMPGAAGTVGAGRPDARRWDQRNGWRRNDGRRAGSDVRRGRA